MAITLQDFANGDTDYVSKLNSNNTTLENAVGGLQTAIAGGMGAAISVGTLYQAMFGTSTARIGAGSAVASISGQTVPVTAGYVWLATSGVVVTTAGATLDLTGQPDDDYYIKVDVTGTPSFSTISTEALWSLNKAGTTLSALAQVAPMAHTPTVGVFYPGAPGNAALMMQYVVVEPITFPVALVDSQAKARLAATATTTITVKKNGVSVGTVVWAAAATAATFTMASATSFAKGDLLEFWNQATADATLGDISITLAGVR